MLPDNLPDMQMTKVSPISTGTTYTLDEAVNKVGYGRFQRRLILLSGLAWTADACEIIILSVIGQILTCDWEIYRWQNALLTSGVFIGMMFGSPAFGIVGDKYGRKKSAMVSLGLLFAFGALSAASPSYTWMLVLRTCTGFALGGIPQLLTLVCEYCPAEMRGRAGFYLCYFWSVGTTGLVLLSWLVMTYTKNWRLLLAIASLPTLTVLCFTKWFPESARYHLVTENTELAENLLNQVAKMNRKELPPGSLEKSVQCSDRSRRGNLLDLLKSEHRRPILIFWYLWSATAFCYYSVALISPILIQKGNINAVLSNQSYHDFVKGLNEIEPCEPMTDQDYIDLLWTSAAEFPGLVVFTFLVEMIDRKKLMCGACVISGILVLFLLIPTKRIIMLLFLFGARGIILSVFQLTLVMLSEAFPTTLRAIALGSGSGFGRFAGLASPYFSQVLIIINPTATIVILSLVIIVAGIATMFLPHETRGVDLTDCNQTNDVKGDKN